MSHPDYEILSAYLDGQLTDEERLRAERLLEEDTEARRLLEELREVSHTVSAMPRHALPDDFAKQIETSLTVQPRTKKVDWQNLRRRYLSNRSLAWVAIIVVIAFAIPYLSPNQDHQIARDAEYRTGSDVDHDGRPPMASFEMSASDTTSRDSDTEQEGVAALHKKQEKHLAKGAQSAGMSERDDAEHLRKGAVPGVDKLAEAHNVDRGGKFYVRRENHLEMDPGEAPMSERLHDKNAATPKRTFAMEGSPTLLAAPRAMRAEEGSQSSENKDYGKRLGGKRPIRTYASPPSLPREDKADAPSHDAPKNMTESTPGRSSRIGHPPQSGFGGMSGGMKPNKGTPPKAWHPKETTKKQEDLSNKRVVQSSSDFALPDDEKSLKLRSPSSLEIVVVCEVNKPAEAAHQFDRLLARGRAASEQKNAGKGETLALNGNTPTKNRPGEEKTYGTSRIALGDGTAPKDSSGKWKNLSPAGKERIVELRWDEAVRLLKALKRNKRQIISIQASASPKLTLPGSISQFNRKSNIDALAPEPEIPDESQGTSEGKTTEQPPRDLEKKGEHRFPKPVPAGYRIRFIFRPASP